MANADVESTPKLEITPVPGPVPEFIFKPEIIPEPEITPEITPESEPVPLAGAVIGRLDPVSVALS